MLQIHSKETNITWIDKFNFVILGVQLETEYLIYIQKFFCFFQRVWVTEHIIPRFYNLFIVGPNNNITNLKITLPEKGCGHVG